MSRHTHKKNKLKKRFDESSAPGLMSCKYFTNTFKIFISLVKHILCTVAEEQERILFKSFLTLVDALKIAPKSKKYKTSYCDEMKSAFPFIMKCFSRASQIISTSITALFAI